MRTIFCIFWVFISSFQQSGLAQISQEIPGSYRPKSYSVDGILSPASGLPNLLLFENHNYSWGKESGTWLTENGKVKLSRRSVWGSGIIRANKELFFEYRDDNKNYSILFQRVSDPIIQSGSKTPPTQSQASSGHSHYERRTEHDPNGIGKFFMGREIAHVMSSDGAEWLDRPEREEEEKTALLVKNLGLKRGDQAVDLGAGTGFITWKMAGEVGPGGRVFAVEIQQEMLDLLSAKMKSQGITNVVPVLGTTESPNLPAGSADLILMVDVYHELEFPYEVMQSVITALKPGGRVVFVEYRAEDPAVPIKKVHKMSQTQLKKEMGLFPLEFQQTIDVLPRQHMMFFRKK